MNYIMIALAPVGDLTGKVALVTGGSRGIGAAIALALADAGADVVVNYLTGEGEAQYAQAEIRAMHRECITVSTDVSNSVEVAGMLTAIERQLGSVSILVHCVGLFKPKPFLEMDEGDWDKILGINLKWAFLITQAVSPSMIENRWGRIIYLSSMVAQMGAPKPSLRGLQGWHRRAYPIICGDGARAWDHRECHRAGADCIGECYS